MKTASTIVHTVALGVVLAVHLSGAGVHLTGMRRALQTMEPAQRSSFSQDAASDCCAQL